MNSLTRLLAIIQKEVRQLSRDRLTFGMIIGIPMIQIVLFGFAINTDVRHLRAGVADQSHTQLAREIVADAQATQIVDVIVRVDTAKQLEDLLVRGDLDLGIFIPADFARRVEQGNRSAIQLLVDGSDPNIFGSARQLTALPAPSHNAEPDAARAALFEVRNYFNPERRSAVNIVPALLGVILTMTMVLFTAVAIVRERERGNLELLITTPVRTVELMLGKIIPYVFIGLLQVSIILALGVFLFRVPIVGALHQIYFASLIFIAANLALGLVISTAAKTQFQAMQMTFFFFLPSILLSGIMFPFAGMPHAAQYFAEVLPLTHFVRIIRGLILRGTDLFDLIPDLRALLIFMGAMLTIAVLRFHKRLD